MSDESGGDDRDVDMEPAPLDAELSSDQRGFDLSLTSMVEAWYAAAPKHIEKDEQSDQQSVIFGSVLNIPKEQKNVIRIFISSTFTDMKVERNVLMSSVFPKLKSYCKKTHNLEFQVVDMRWGVQDQASDDHSTSEICMREIMNCQKESAGPNFVCLVGNRYGTRYLKKYILEEQWGILVSRIRSAEVKKLLDIWYKLDINAKVPQRILQPISSVASGTGQWKSSYPVMYSALKDAAVQARNDGELSADVAQAFICSVTEEEIACAGMLDGKDMEQKEKCLAFMRNIRDIDLEHQKAKRFVDMTQPGQLDVDSQDLLRKLKEKLSENVPEDNVKQYTINWSDKDGINAEDHQDYLKQFSEDFFEGVKKLVDLSVSEQDKSSLDVYSNEVSREVLTHFKQAIDKLSKVVPRTDILEKVKDYITGQSDRPLVVHGNSGCGKTSIMASVAVEAGSWLSAEGSKMSTVILRFLGTSRSSSDFELLLKSLNFQLTAINKREINPKISASPYMPLKRLIDDFHRRLLQFSDNRTGTLVIILDSIDQLRKNELAFNLSWLPKTLPRGVKIIISTLPDVYGILDCARSLRVPTSNFVEVKALTESSAWVIIDKWLAMSDRKISDKQRAAVTTTFADKQLPPLYIKLIFDILVKWTSYNTAMTIPEDITVCMDQLFTHLESTHGKLQVQLALAYLTCCPGGISENELEDVLSIDDEFLTAVFQYHIPPVRRIPPSLWVRIKNDIRDYLVEKESFGVAALTWYHRQFIEHASKRYAGKDCLRTKHCMNTLCEYYKGNWSDRDKPFSYSQKQMEILKLTEAYAKAPRYVAAQPTKYSRHEFNGRKISVLSQLWTNSVMKDQVYMNSSRYIMDIEFLTGKFVIDSWTTINEELTCFAKQMNEDVSITAKNSEKQMYKVEFNYIHAVLKMYHSLLTTGPLSLPAQLFACLQDKYNLASPKPPSETTLPNLAWFLTELIYGKGVEITPLLPVTKILNSPGGIERTAEIHTNTSMFFPFVFQGKSAVAVLGRETAVHVLEENGDVSQLMSLELSIVVEYGQLITVDSESCIFAYNSRCQFCLISLDHKRLEIEEPYLKGEPTNDFVYSFSNSLEVFYNSRLFGEDSIMFYSFRNELVIVYSLKLRKVVWHHYIPGEYDEIGRKAEIIYYASLHDSSVSHVKTLIITCTRHTDFYKMVLLKSGEVQMTKIEKKQNAFYDQKNKGVCALSDVSSFKHGQQQMDIILPNLPVNNCFVLTDKSTVMNGVWNYYKLVRPCYVYMAGKLRCGKDIIAVYSPGQISTDKQLIELYSASSTDSLLLSAVFQCDAAPCYVYLAPESDVLIVSFKEGTALYFLSIHPDDSNLLDVRLAYEIGGASEVPSDILADPKGFIYIAWSKTKVSKVWDLTAYVDDEKYVNNPRLLAVEPCKSIVTPAQSVYCALVLQDDGHLWDVSTNRPILHRLYDSDEDDETVAAQWFAGTGEWQHIVAIVKTNSLRVFGLNLPKVSPPSDVSVKLLNTHQLTFSPEVSTYETGVIALATLTGCMVHFYMDKKSGHAIKKHYLKAPALTTDDNWFSAGFTSTKYCYADTVFLVAGYYRGPDVNYFDPATCALIYNTSDFQLIKKIVNFNFNSATYFKECKKIVLVRESLLGIMDLNVSDLNSLAISEISTDEYGRLKELDSYVRNEQMCYTDTQPYFFIDCEKKGLLKMDVRQTDGWANGIGVVTLGICPEFYEVMRISHNHKYLAGTRSHVPAVQLVRIKEDRLELMGEIQCQGGIEKFTFSTDNQYIILVLQSGEVVCAKILDPSLADLKSEANKLPCTKQPLCQTQDEMLKDERWTSMVALSEQATRVRDNNTLYNYMRNLVMPEDAPKRWKAKEPTVGSEEFVELISSLGFASDVMDSTTNSYISAIATHPLDTDTLLETDKNLEKLKLKPHPPSLPKPRPLSAKQQSMQVEPSRSLNAPAAAGERLLLPQGLLMEIQSHVFRDNAEAETEEVIPANLKLYYNLPTDEREKRLDGTVQDLSKHTAVCNIQ